jgi:ubiquinone/menaquinone biosynthesis C-methylase UbiE
MIRKQYNDIAFIYDLLAEGDDGLIWFRHNLEPTLNKLPKGALVLDCSCGTGNHAIWLAEQGFDVHASDISDGMLEAAKEKAAKEGLSINFFQCSWEELPEKSICDFDLIVCPGNSLSHLPDLNMLDQIFPAFKKVLKPGGKFFFDIRNWEKTYAENALEDQQFQVEGKDGNYDVWYRYDMPEWNQCGQMHVDISPAGEENYQRFSFDFLPVGYPQLKEAAMRAGFEKIERGFFPNEDYYFVLAE